MTKAKSRVSAGKRKPTDDLRIDSDGGSQSGSFLAGIFPEPRPGFGWVTGTKLTKDDGRHIFVCPYREQ